MESKDRINNFFRCPYGSRQDSWEIVGDSKMFKVIYKCKNKEDGGECLEANYSKYKCKVIDTILHSIFKDLQPH